ncbi:MAG: hypothetical protein D6760_07780 [Deltaproteobacteria bacterium]|nr:MAG: hypothetical protein D6760_07780 [Deltaproteobacteria bacterium]
MLDMVAADAGASSEDLAVARAALLTIWRTVLDVLRFQSAGSIGRASLKLALESATKKVVSEGLYDPPPPVTSALPAWAPARVPALEFSRDSMMNWASDDADMYRTDRSAAVSSMNRGLEDASNSLAAAIEFLAYAQASDIAAEVFDLVGKFYKLADVAKYLFEAGKWAFNIQAFALPAFNLYSVLDDSTDAAVYRMYGAAMPPLRAERLVPAGPSATVTANDSLRAGVVSTAADLEATIGIITTALGEDRIFDVLTVVAGDNGQSLLDRLDAFVRARDRFLAQAAAIDRIPLLARDSYQDLFLGTAEILAHRLVTLASLRDLYIAVLVGTYDGPQSQQYLAHRDQLLHGLQAMSDSVGKASQLASSFASATTSSAFAPVVLVDSLDAVSDATGDTVITASPETFTVTARIKNISSAPIAGVSARLTVDSRLGSASLVGAAEQSAGSPDLAADDGVEGTGADEVLLTWQVTYNGNLFESDPIGLTVELLEGGTQPSAFAGEPRSMTLARSYDLIDGDGDSIPDHYERANGLDPTADDARGDLDQDGADNLTEYLRGTLVAAADTDGDGLDDGEELSAGADGYLTDPFERDTDGDGVEDPIDGNPIDGAVTTATAPPEEPKVAVSRQTVVLDAANPVASVVVSNGGGGQLEWSAAADDPLIVSVSPNFPAIAAEGGTLTISLPPGVDPAVLSSLATTVSVIDVAGADKDNETIGVAVGTNATEALCGHGTNRSLGSNVTASDALFALTSAVGSTTCEPCRCDVDSSGSVTATDALRILNKAVGLPGTLACPGC